MKCFVSLILALSLTTFGFGQNVGIGTTTPSATAALDVNSQDKGLLLPRLTSQQRKAIVNPAKGLLVFDLDKNAFYFYTGGKWAPLAIVEERELPPVEFGSGKTGTDDVAFGFSVGIFGDFIAVGAPLLDTLNRTNPGLVRIYRKSEGEWSLNQTIISPNIMVGGQFGYALDMHGPYLIIGAPYEDPANINSAGMVYIYRRNENTGQYVFEAEFAHPQGAKVNGSFGFSVGIASNSNQPGGVAAVVGSPAHFLTNQVQDRFGSASFYRRGNDGIWVHINTVNGNQHEEEFGHAVAIDSIFAIIGAPKHDGDFALSGRVDIRRSNGFNYSTFDGAINPQSDTSRQLGYSVAVDSSLFMVAGTGGTTNVVSPVRFYRRLGAGNYDQTFQVSPLIDFEENAGSIAGNKLAFSKSLMLIGVPHRNAFAGTIVSALGRKNYALVYGLAPFSSTLKPDLSSQQFEPKNRADSRFGQSVAVFGKTYVIGMPELIGINGKGSFFIGNLEE